MKNRYMTSLFIAFICFLASTISAQTDSTIQAQQSESIPGVEIETSISKAEIYIGDLVEYDLTIIYDSSIELTPPPLGGNLGAFDVKDYQPDIETKLKDGRLKSENKFTLSTFTTGDYVIPPIPIQFTMPDGTKKVMLSEAVPIKVLSLLLNIDDSTEIKPLKPQYEFKRDYTLYYIIGGVLLLLLLIAGIIIRQRRLKALGYVEPVDNRPAWEIAFEKMAFLKQNDYITKSEFKLYYIELTEIIRHFHEKVYKQNFTDMTTEELLNRFKEIELPESLYENTKKFFQHADLVKFAKYIPEASRSESDYELVHQMIEQVRIDVLKKEEEVRLIEAQKNKITDKPKENEVIS